MEQQTKTQEMHAVISKDMTLGDVVAKYPQSIEIMLSYGLHCVGCHVSYWETIEEGARGHGMDDAQISEMLGKMNAAASEPAAGGEITVTKKAADKIKQIMSDNKKDGWGLRVSIIPGGCSGFSYGFDFAKDPTPQDVTINANDVNLIVDQESMKLLRGSKIDYVDALQGSGFKVINPNAGSSCGCGQSFSA